MKTVWVILRGGVGTLPPVMSLLKALLALRCRKVVFVSTEPSGISDGSGLYKEYILDLQTGPGFLGKARKYLKFRRFVRDIIGDGVKEGDVVWLGSLDTALALRMGGGLNGGLLVLQLHELYDTYPVRLKLIRGIAKRAKVVVTPELNRAAILKVWLGLREFPMVIPNKPYWHPRSRFLEPSTYAIRDVIDKHWVEGKKVIIYQGHVGSDRGLLPLAHCMKSLTEYELWIVGPDHGCVAELLSISSNIKYLGYFPAPLHLEITSYARIGVMSYDAVNLNNVFCAPNKIWEYAGFGIPSLSNNAPSLVQVFEANMCGVSVEFDSAGILDGVRRIERHIQMYEAAAYKYFDSVDLVCKVFEVIKAAEIRGSNS